MLRVKRALGLGAIHQLFWGNPRTSHKPPLRITARAEECGQLLFLVVNGIRLRYKTV